MSKRIRFTPLLLLFAIIIIVSIAATPAQLAAPAAPTVQATGNDGEIVISWDKVPGAQYYTVGWVNWTAAKPLYDAGQDWLNLFHYTTVPGNVSSYTVRGLTAGDDHYGIIRATDAGRFGGGYSQFSAWSSSAAQPAGQHGDGFCPITGLPLPDDGYLSVGNTVTSDLGDQSFTVASASAPATVTLDYADDPSQQFSPRDGRRFIQVCGTFRHDFSSGSSFDVGWESIIDSDAGVGFVTDSTHESIEAQTDGFGCEVWNIPATAQTAVYAVGLGAYNSRTGISGIDSSDLGLYRIDLASVPTTFTPTPTSTSTTTLVPLTNQELTRLVKSALGQIVVTNSDGSTVSGTGFVVRSDGLMVTNRHVVDDAQTVTVWMNTLDGQTLQLTGTVLGRGILADLAVVQLPTNRTYSTLSLADSDAVSGADEVTAWGYPRGSISGTYPTITRGIISSKGIYGDVDFLQTDAAINPGNSGGPLIDQYGNVVGVNTMKSVDATIDNQGFAITSNEVSNRLNTLIAGGRASETYRNTKHGYGYSVDIPRGWYLSRENSSCTIFHAYHRQDSAAVCTYDITDSFGRSNDKLAVFAQWKREDMARVAQEREFQYFLPFGFSRVKTRVDGVTTTEYYDLQYKLQIEAEHCVSDRIMRVALSSRSGSSNAFTWRVSVCEDSLNQYRDERDTMINSFRP